MAAYYIFDMFIILLVSVVLPVSSDVKATTRPNIVFIVADDLGWDDVSFHGSAEVLTPNIDLLAYTGVTLGRYYTHCVCTPSRAALLSGKFAHTLGMHGLPLSNSEDRGLPLSEKLLPEYLKELGYSTHLVGKWHLGMSRKAYLPTSRGFDSHFGYRGGAIDYYEYILEESWALGKQTGFDLYRNLTPAWDVEGYMTDVLTNEAKSIIKSHDETRPLFLMLSHLATHCGNEGAALQVPSETVRSMRHVVNPERRFFAAMVKELDESVGEIVKSLSEKKVLNNTIIVFISDNGGMPIGLSANYASNWPMRGSKFTPFEGGTRAAALLWTPTLISANHLWNGYMHVVDWLPTIFGAIGAELPSKIDGINLWNDITSNLSSQRHDFYEIYTYGDESFSSITSSEYKLIVGNVTKLYSTHLGGDRRGIIGDGPSYVDTIKKSELYAVLKKMGKSFKVEDIDLRDSIRIDCDHTQNVKKLCYSDTDGVCMFNIKEDPCERRDLSQIYPAVAASLMARLQGEMSRTVERPIWYKDPRAMPHLHNYTWTTWADDV